MLARGDILDLGDKVQGVVLRVTNQRDARQDPDNLPVLVEVSFFHLVGLNLPIQHLAHVPEVSLQIVWMGDGLERRG